MKRIILILLALSIVGNVVLVVCKTSDKTTYAEVVSDPAELINGIRSYQTLYSTIQLLQAENQAFKVDEGQRVYDDKRLPFNIDTIMIQGYTHLQQSGKLELVFFNNRLQSTKFYPDNVPVYLEMLKKHSNIDLVANNEVAYLENAKVRKYKETMGSKLLCIVWEDLRLVAEHNKWICQYS